MNYNCSPYFEQLCKKIQDEIDDLVINISIFKKIEKRTKEETKLLRSLQSQHKSRMISLQNLKELKIPFWNLLLLVISTDGTEWNEEQRKLWNSPIASYEGRGESSLRSFYSLQPAKPSLNDIDIPEISLEAKNIQGRTESGKEMVQSILPGKTGRISYCKWVLSVAESGMLRELDNNIREAIAIGELGKSSNIPNNISMTLHDAVKPSIVFSKSKALALTTSFGFLLIRECDYDQALEFTNITKCYPKYSLKKDYLISRLLTPKDSTYIQLEHFE